MAANSDAPKGGRDNQRFQDQAEQPAPGLAREFLDFLRYNKKWWLAPIILVLLALGLAVVLSGTGAAPFIYTLF